MKDRINLLDVVPVHNDSILSHKEGGCCVLSLPRFKNKWMQKHLIPRKISPYVRVTLEEHGSAVWELIDGKKNVSEIIDAMEEYFRNEESYEARVTAFLTQLNRDGLIKFLTKR